MLVQVVQAPVLIDIPKDIQTEKISMTEYNKLYEVPIHLEGYDPTYKGHQGQIKKQLHSLKMQSVRSSLLVQVY